MAAVQDKLFGSPGRQLGRCGKGSKCGPIPWPGARKREMRLKRTSIGLQPDPYALRLDLRCKLAGLIGARAELQPDHADEPPALERSDLAQLELQATQRQAFQPPGDLVHHLALDAADEPDRQVQVLGRRPAKLRCNRRARREEWPQPRALRVRQGEPQERADFQRRAGFLQFVGTQLLGAVGRHP